MHTERRRELRFHVTGKRKQRADEAPVERACRERCDAADLHRTVERLVEVAKPLVMRAVAGLVDTKQRHDETRGVLGAADATRRLNIFGGGLRLAQHAHETKPGNVEPDGDHVRRDRTVDSVGLIEGLAQTAPRLCNLVGGHS